MCTYLYTIYKGCQRPERFVSAETKQFQNRFKSVLWLICFSFVSLWGHVLQRNFSQFRPSCLPPTLKQYNYSVSRLCFDEVRSYHWNCRGLSYSKIVRIIEIKLKQNSSKTVLKLYCISQKNASAVKRFSCFSQSQSLSAVCVPSQRLGQNDDVCGCRLRVAKTAETSFHGCFNVCFD